MRRRDLLVCLGVGAAVWSPLARAQQRVWRVGWLHPTHLTPAHSTEQLAVFRKELASLGYVEGENLTIETRAAEGHFERLPGLANDLVQARCDVIVAIATPAIAAAQKVTTTLPIVMTPATDPIGSGFVKSLARPGGNITGLANMYPDLSGKSFELISELFPSAKRIAILTSSNATHDKIFEEALALAPKFGLSLLRVPAPKPEDIDGAFAKAKAEGSDAVLVIADPTRTYIIAASEKAQVPTVYQQQEYVHLGGLVSYGPNLLSLFRRSAHYVAKLLSGMNPAELPVEQPTDFLLSVNLNAARRWSIAIPPLLLTRADEIIE